MSVIAETAGANQQVSRGSVIIEQGSFSKTLVILNQGSALYRKVDENNIAKPIIMVKGPAVLGCDSLLGGQEYHYEIVAASDSVVSCYVANKDSLLKIFASKPNIGLLVIRSAYKECAEVFSKISKLNALMSQLIQANDSLSLAYSVIAKDKFKDDPDKADLGSIDPVLPQARVVVQQFLDKGGNIPEKLTEQFLLSDHSSFLRHEYNPPEVIKRDDLAYYKRFVSLPPQIQGAIAQKDAAFYFLTGQRIAKMTQALMSEVSDSFQKLEDSIEGIIEGDYCWLGKIKIEIELLQQNVSTVDDKDLYFYSKYLVDVLQILQERYAKGFSLPLKVDIQLGLQTLLEFTAKEPEEDVVTTEESSSGDAVVAGENYASIKGEVTNSAKKIFQWAGMNNEALAEYSKLMVDLKALKNPLDHEGDARKIRRTLNGIFWKLYETAALKYFQEKIQSLPRVVEMFFNFAFLEETILEEEQILAIYNGIDHSTTKYPIHYALEWLQLIYEDKVPTSVNELGLTFFELVRQDNRDAGWKKETDLPANVNSPEARIKFEIENMLKTNVKLTSGSVLNHFSILSKYQITMSMSRAMVSKSALADELDTLLSKDFSAFHREVLFDPPKEMAIKREFIQMQIIPNIIIVPSAGSVFQFWQDREGKSKSSPGRIIAPSLAMADMYTMLLSAVGALRWETIKTIMGVDWNNIANSSLTADYVDYVQFFKKNRELSAEVKEKLSAEFKRFRDDRARFVNDYSIWVKFESDGTQRFNKVARKIFSKHVPFAKEIREKLLKLPSYTDLVQKSINIRKRKAKELEPRYRKCRQDNNGILPQEMEDTYSFFNMET